MRNEYSSSEEKMMTPEEIRFVKDIGRNIRYYRKIKNLTQEQLGELARVSYKYLGEIERGRKKASIIVVYRIAGAMQLSVSDVVKLSKKQGEAYQKCIRAIIRILENKPVDNLKQALTLLKNFLQRK